MLIEIFLGERDKFIKEIVIEKIVENKKELRIEYKTINTEKTNLEKNSPYIIIQTRKIKNKKVTFIENGIEYSKAKELYINN
jgi:hypothetical protein